MRSAERRVSRRFNLRIPLIFHRVTSRIGREQSAKSLNISAKGVYLATNVALFVGQRVQVRLLMPKRVTGKEAVEWCFGGSVKHVELQPKGSPPGSWGVGVGFDC
jgi:hypothetical protein